MTGSCSGWASGFSAAPGTMEGAGPAAVEVVVEEVVVVAVVGGGREGREGGAVCSPSTTRFKLVCCPAAPCVSSSPPFLLALLLCGSGDGVRCFIVEFLRGFGTGRFTSVVGWEAETGGA